MSARTPEKVSDPSFRIWFYGQNVDKNAKSACFVLITPTDNSDLTRFFGVQSARSEKVIAIPCSYALLVL